MKIKDSLSRKIFNVCNVIFLCLFCVVVLFPYINLLAKSFNDGADTAKGGIWLWPREFTLDNYKAVFSNHQFLNALFISVSRVLIAVVTHVMVQFMAAYTFLHKRLVGHKALTMFFMIPMYFSGGIICNYILFSKIGLLNNYLVYVLPGMFSFYNMLIIRSYLESIPPALRESSKIDGANDIQTAFLIVFPLAKPVLATIALWTAVGVWNDWTTTMYYVTKPKLQTLQFLLQRVMKESSAVQSMVQEAAKNGEQLQIATTITPEAVQAAQIMITTIPIVITYPFLQKYFISGVTLGAVKD